MKRSAEKKSVLVGVLKTRRDRSIFLRERWYRIPLAHVPRRPFDYIALYQPAFFGREGKRISYYARAISRRIVQRRDLLPDEPHHVRAGLPYLRIGVGIPRKLARPIRNTSPRRVSFGFTTLARLHTARNILELYTVAPTEEVMKRGLERAGVKAVPQYIVIGDGRRFRLDFAIFCRRGCIAIECDNRKAHSGKRQKQKDRTKDAFLRRHGWTVLRFKEVDIVSGIKICINRVRREIHTRGGLIQQFHGIVGKGQMK